MTEYTEFTDDDFLGGKIVLRQPVNGYRATSDAVFLAAAVNARSGDSVLEVGIGTGAAALCLAARLPDIHITGWELQPQMVALARTNVKLNGMDNRIDVIETDIFKLSKEQKQQSFHHIITNPPYGDCGTPPPDPVKAIAHAGEIDDIGLWITACIKRLRPQGSLTVICRADRLDLLLAAMYGKIGAITVFPLWSKKDANAVRIIVSGICGRKSPLTLKSGLILHNDDGSRTEEAEKIMREVHALERAV